MAMNIGVSQNRGWSIGVSQATAHLYQDYTRESVSPLPSGEDNLATLFSDQDYLDVATVNSVYVDQMSANRYAVFLWKDNVSVMPFVVTFIGKSTRATTLSTAYLQIYNIDGSTWETIDSDDVTSAGTDFTLTAGILTNLSNYIDASGWISCRTYQQAI